MSSVYIWASTTQVIPLGPDKARMMGWLWAIDNNLAGEEAWICSWLLVPKMALQSRRSFSPNKTIPLTFDTHPNPTPKYLHRSNYLAITWFGSLEREGQRSSTLPTLPGPEKQACEYAISGGERQNKSSKIWTALMSLPLKGVKRTGKPTVASTFDVIYSQSLRIAFTRDMAS
jgi:hypothetical protein